jgi:hypothetical protein
MPFFDKNKASANDRLAERHPQGLAACEPTRGEWTAKRNSTASYVTRENLAALRLFFEHRRETLVFTIAHRRIWRGKSEISSGK